MCGGGGGGIREVEKDYGRGHSFMHSREGELGAWEREI
jgi:hypothetical protein